jgi:dTDP-glucose pyrophosphorylase
MVADWKKILLSPHASAEKALQVLDEGGLRLVMVVDDTLKLLGTLTDGDIRRALLRHVDISKSSVADIMHSTPRTAFVGSSRGQIRHQMEMHSLLHIPLIDSEGTLQGLEIYQEPTAQRLRHNWVFLMAGGFGKRLKPLTDHCPKPMLQVGGKPMLQTILEGFIAAGFHRFCISVHYLPETIKNHFGDGRKWGVTIVYVEEDQPLGTGGALGLLPDTGSLPVIMMNGDILTKLDFNALLDFHESQQAELTLCVREYDMQVPFGVVEGNGSTVLGITEKPQHRFFVNAGIYVVTQAAIARTIPARRVDMPDLIKEIIAEQRQVSMFPIREYWLDIGRPEDFDTAQQSIHN